MSFVRVEQDGAGAQRVRGRGGRIFFQVFHVYTARDVRQVRRTRSLCIGVLTRLRHIRDDAAVTSG